MKNLLNFSSTECPGTIARIILLNPKSDQVTSLLRPSWPSDSPASLAWGSTSPLHLPPSHRPQQVSIMSYTKYFHCFNLHGFLACRLFNIVFSLSGAELFLLHISMTGFFKSHLYIIFSGTSFLTTISPY